MLIREPAEREYEVAVLGSGPAGLTVALRLQAHGIGPIALVESGGFGDDPAIQSLSRVGARGDIDAAAYPLHAQRRFGGTSAVWSGLCTTLERRHFENGGWPIPFDELARHYPTAALVLDLPPQAHEAPEAPIGASGRLVYKPLYASPPTRLGAKFRARVEASSTLHLITGKTCVALAHEGGRVRAATLRDSRAGRDDPVTLRRAPLRAACGGLGNPRLLQLSGLAGATPVGTHFMEHPHSYLVGELELDQAAMDAVAQRIDGVRVLHALAFSDRLCAEEGRRGLSVSFELDRVEERVLLGRRRPVYVGQASVRGEMAPDPRNRVRLAASATSWVSVAARSTSPSAASRTRAPRRGRASRSSCCATASPGDRGTRLLRDGHGRRALHGDDAHGAKTGRLGGRR